MPIAELDIADWRRRVFALYAEIRATSDPRAAHMAWLAAREALFRQHPQSPIAAGRARSSWMFHCFPYDPRMRRVVDLQECPDSTTVEIPVGDDGILRLRPFSRTVGLADIWGSELTVFGIEGYGGGIFLPFTDATSGQETYGGGRYLLDTIKGADLGASDDGVVLDFNFACQPSCSYSPRWVCPLAPPENHLAVGVRAGERVA
ncbi:MAG: DUF1684 domain-containing protein [Proteobacteria bacterium]|nr:DUF1684 domain-containing protein [Pseudomonadota bacterium]MDA1057693.1 DUF1684 domain-containing protein [Pseudomonadota bacterium]